MREGIREQPEKSESASGKLSQARRGGNPATGRRRLTVNFLFSPVASFRTFRKVFRSWIDLPGRLNSQVSTVPPFFHDISTERIAPRVMGSNAQSSSKRLRMKMKEELQAASEKLMSETLNLLGVLVRKMSRKQSTRFASLIGDFMHRVIGIRRDLVYRNLGLTFPEKSPEEIRRIATAMYRNVASSLLEVLRLPLIRNREDAAALVDIDGEAFLQWYRTRKTGAVFVSAHYGNWELMAMASGLLVEPIAIVVKRLRNHELDQRMNEYRTMRGNRIIYHSQALREGLRLLGEGGFLTILGDQSDHDAVNYGEFLGRRASMYYGPAFFALKAKVPLFFVVCQGNGEGRYTVKVREVNTSDLTFSKEAIATLAARYTRMLEEEIRNRPEEWFWLHNRWKRG